MSVQHRRLGRPVAQEDHKHGMRGAHLLRARLELARREFTCRCQFRCLDVHGQWQELTVPASGLAFTWCQVPIVYHLRGEGRPSLTITLEDGGSQTLQQLSLPAELSSELFRRSGRIRQVSLALPKEALLGD